MSKESALGKLFKKIEELDINHEERYEIFQRQNLPDMCTSVLEKQDVAILTIGTCACGCGQLNLHLNKKVITKEQAMYVLQSMAKLLEDQFKLLN